MNFISKHIQKIIAQYNGEVPLSVFLKKYYGEHKNIGSRDRKAISEGVYIFYRCGNFYQGEIVINIINKGIQLCNSKNKILIDKITADKQLPHPNDLQIAYPISEGLAYKDWLQSMWQQPNLFIRLREKTQSIIHSLKSKNIEFDVTTVANQHLILSFQNSENINKLIDERLYVVQDRSSQMVIIEALQQINKVPETIWDVCSGAGGKSLLIQDLLQQQPQILATDVRKSILHNLQMRAKLYGIKNIKTLVYDNARTNEQKQRLINQQFDMVICDVPCSGSGTWARTPEQFYFFPSLEIINSFHQIQKQIALNASKNVANGGYFLYITCSVFASENEAVVKQIQQQTTLQLLQSKNINGIPHKADVMFYALFQQKN